MARDRGMSLSGKIKAKEANDYPIEYIGFQKPEFFAVGASVEPVRNRIQKRNKGGNLGKRDRKGGGRGSVIKVLSVRAK